MVHTVLQLMKGNMIREEILKAIYSKPHTIKCSKCGKTMEVPNLMNEETRDKVLSPYCCTFTVFLCQWLIHHGWHIRNLGIGDSHPYFCPDCFKEGTPEYEARDYGKQWCEQAEAWVKTRED